MTNFKHFMSFIFPLCIKCQKHMLATKITQMTLTLSLRCYCFFNCSESPASDDGASHARQFKTQFSNVGISMKHLLMRNLNIES